MNIIDGKMPEVHKYGSGYRWYNTEDGVSRWSQTLELIPEPRQFSEKYILNFPEEFGLITRTQLVKFAQWFNENQWRGGQGDKVKRAFIDCDYKKIVFNGLKEI